MTRVIEQTIEHIRADEGFAASDVQVSNFETREHAADYATSFGFEVVDTVAN